MNWLKTITIICTVVTVLAGLQYINLLALHKDRVDFYGFLVESSTEMSAKDKKAELAAIKRDEIAINKGKMLAKWIFLAGLAGLLASGYYWVYKKPISLEQRSVVSSA